MAGVNNQPNLKPLIDSQSTAQSTELAAAEQAINASIEAAKAELSIKSDSVKAAVNAAKTLITDDAQLKADELALIVEAAKDAVLADMSEKISALQLAVDAPKSIIKLIQRGKVTGDSSSIQYSVQVSPVNMSKSVLNVTSSSGGYIATETSIWVAKGNWELIEYV